MLDEDMIIERTKEPDGTPYNFKALYVRVKKPDGITLGSTSMIAYLERLWSFPIWMPETNKTSEMWCYAELVQYMGLWKRGRAAEWGIYGSIVTPYQMQYEMFERPIDRGGNIVKLIANSPLKANVTYEIWGARA